MITLKSHAVVIDIYAGGELGTGSSVTYVPSAMGSDWKKTAQSYGAMIGIDIPLLRAEAEYNYIHSKNVDLHAGMINGYVKFGVLPFATPYIGVGIGEVFGGTLTDNGGSEADADSSTAYQAMLGLQFDIPATPVFVDIEGRVFYADSIYSVPAINKDVGFTQYDIRAKIRYVF